MGACGQYPLRPRYLGGNVDTPEHSAAAIQRHWATLSRTAHFRPEFLNRVDDIVLFKPLTQDEIEHIVGLMFNDLRNRLADRRMTIELTEAAQRHIAREGFDPVYGARPLRRFIAREVETWVGRALVSGDVRDGATIRVDLTYDELVVTYGNPTTSDPPARKPEHADRAREMLAGEL